ncbi:MAG: ORF6N domain-containing protein [Bacilli bacterium]|nr:ORF6N domain-containing protein [Bacilli bacterium]
MNNIMSNNEIHIEDMIYEIRGRQVILDRDLAKLYHTETRVFMQSVKRNIKRFPANFMFQLTYEEFLNWRSHFVMSKSDLRGLRRPPYAFTEEGVAMLSGILNSEIAITINIQIIEAFIIMRKYISSSLVDQKYINNLVLEHEEKLKFIENTLSNFNEKNNHLFFEGQIYDAYSLLLDIFNKAKGEIIVIDNYIDKSILDILSKTNRIIKIVTNKYNNQDYAKYKKQYDNVELIIDNSFHDRFIIVDRKTLYHCGASFKDLGNKCFEISKINDIDILNKILKKISQ